jgi:Sec-independent protein translocase protein TatA
MSFLSPLHIAFFAAIALLALGPKRFPEFTKTLGNTMREFREVMSSMPGRDSLSVPRPDADGAATAVAATPAPAPVAAAPAGAPAAAEVTGAPASAAVRSPSPDAQPPAP